MITGNNEIDKLLSDAFMGAKDQNERDEVVKNAEALKKFYGQAQTTLEEPSIEDSRATRGLDLEFKGLKDDLTLRNERIRQGRSLQDYGDRTEIKSAARDRDREGAVGAQLAIMKPEYAELAAGREMSDAQYTGLRNQEYADRAAFRDVQKQALENQKFGNILNLVKGLGIGGAILLS